VRISELAPRLHSGVAASLAVAACLLACPPAAHAAGQWPQTEPPAQSDAAPSIAELADLVGAATQPASELQPWLQAQAESGPVEDEPDPLFDEDDEYDRDIAGQQAGFPDPLETPNRGILHFNRFFDRLIFDPITRLYDWLIPEPMEPAIRRAFQHWASPSILLNDVLQLHFGSARDTCVRFVVNSTVGLGGLFDFARCNGFERHSSDFGQTLANYGVPSGPYLMLPLFGPSNVRDAFGDLVDAFLHPARYFLGPAQALTYGSSAGLATRERHYHALNELEKSAVDFYAALRNAYYQARMAEIEEQVDRDVVGPMREEYQAPCTATLDGAKERTIGPRPARGLSVRPATRWSPPRNP